LLELGGWFEIKNRSPVKTETLSQHRISAVDFIDNHSVMKNLSRLEPKVLPKVLTLKGMKKSSA